jgi:hypothetical protein
MTRITVSRYPAGDRIRLTPSQVRAFELEFRRVRRAASRRAWGVPHLVAPDCVVTVTRDGRRRRYLLCARTILVDERTRRKWQFYFGLLLLEWLNR